MIVAFYSYKGGVGRSQLCANIAAYYCFKKGKKVLLWDWDFEAPGLHYFFGKKTDELTQKGTLEMLEDYTSMMRTRTNISEDDYTFLDKKNIISLQKGEPENKDIGQIGLIAGGDYNNNFTFRVNHFDWYEFYELLDGKVYIESVKKWAKGLGYDYILIDSRTGINDYSGICNLQLPDANVVVMAANQQNIQGCKRIVGQIIKAEYTTQGYREPYVLPILSRINVNHPNFGDWANEFTEVFYFTLKELKVNVNEDFIKEIFRDFYLDKTLLGDEARFSAGENVLFTSERQFIPRASFMAKFRNIANYLEDLKMNKRIDMNTQIDKETWLYYAEKAVEENNDKAAAYAYEKADELDKSIEYGGNAKAFLKKGDVFFNVNKFDKAIANYQKVIFFKKNNYEAFFKLGLTYDNKKEYDKAIAAYQKAIDIKPDFHEAFFNMGIAYDDKKEYGKAIAAYQKAIDIKPDFHEAFFNMGSAYDDKKEYDKAIAAYQKAIDIKPDKHEAFYNMGSAYDDKKEYDKAIAAYQKAIDIKPDFHEAFYNMGSAYVAKKEYDKAIAAYQKAIDIKPDKHEAFYNMGNAYKNKKEYDKAIAAYQKAIDIKPDFHEAFYNMGNAYKNKKEYDKAIAAYQKAIDIKPDKHEAFYNMGNAYSAKKEYDKAIAAYQKAIDIKPDKHEAFYNMGSAYDDKKEYDKAIAAYQKAIDIKPDFHEAFYNMGNAYKNKKEYDKAIAAYQKAIDIKPDFHEAFFNMGIAYDEKKEYDKAIAAYQKAIELAPNESWLYIGYGFLLLKTGKLQEAQNIIEKGIELGNLDMSQMNLGHIYLIKKQEKKALELYIKSLEAFENKTNFWKGMETDYEDLNFSNYGITQEYYNEILEKIKESS